jgi:hypothetical protein
MTDPTFTVNPIHKKKCESDYGDSSGCGAFGDYGGGCSVGNAATKLMKTTTTT